jgi:hypothetical protein
MTAKADASRPCEVASLLMYASTTALSTNASAITQDCKLPTVALG